MATDTHQDRNTLQGDDRHSLTSSHQERSTLALQVAAAIDRQERQEALRAILTRLEQARREHADHYLAQRLRRETSQELS